MTGPRKRIKGGGGLILLFSHSKFANIEKIILANNLSPRLAPCTNYCAKSFWSKILELKDVKIIEQINCDVFVTFQSITWWNFLQSNFSHLDLTSISFNQSKHMVGDSCHKSVSGWRRQEKFVILFYKTLTDQFSSLIFWTRMFQNTENSLTIFKSNLLFLINRFLNNKYMYTISFFIRIT